MQQASYRLTEVDLSSGRTNVRELVSGDLRNFLGGASLGARTLYPYLIKAREPLAPEAPLLLATGPLTGTAGPAVGRLVICAKSPATRLWGESNLGGFFGADVGWGGFDGVLTTGRAPQPVFLWLHDGVLEVRPASHLWGVTDTYATQSAIKVELGDVSARVATIGRAGEVGIPFALVLCDHGRVAGRTGMGAVMGSKNLKAIAVRGTAGVPVMQPGVV